MGDIQQNAPNVVAVVQHNHQVVTVFDGNNAINFTMAFSNFAKQQGFWDIVNGTTERPDEDERAQERWDRQNAQALNSLRSWIAPRKLHLFLYSPEDTARDVWMRIERRTGGQGAQARRSEARRRLRQHFQKAGEPLEDWLAELNARFMDLELTNFPGMDDALKKETLLDQVHPTHKLIAQQIDIQVPNSSYGEFFNLFLDRAEMQTSRDDMPSQGYLSYKGGKPSKGKPNFKSKNGRNPNHNRGREAERKRENSGANRRSVSRTKFQGKCHKCHRYGHKKQSECRSGGRRSSSFNARTNDEEESYCAYMAIPFEPQYTDDEPDLTDYSSDEDDKPRYVYSVYYDVESDNDYKYMILKLKKMQVKILT